MKVEYSYYGDKPSLIIKGSDFVMALKDREEHNLLEIAADGFCAKFNVLSHFDERVNNAVKLWLDKTGNVIYVIKERWIGRTLMDSWCEVYVLNGTRLIEVVFSNDNGRNYILRDAKEADIDG
jgi:hypothetical protein